ncbi:carboxylating nicotinate-nucleotide diphosphorylase [Acanthopleuribacter pedis]|uniref:nicotinate-nucleotide diphosphorylase (carboxylating) n=1 Tax=Acanthopleuribacter pedis TaxID=442870 RepID=A0A8J7QB89_9BACT|nr:carboxylating nicotinate-nucleotide diphosphorylase [Acanthopleuribacter pedis]MBO1321267.1 carboxylating nicotinate-nucleotide diphosphorylase [Acanthopleuribacter pedis]
MAVACDYLDEVCRDAFRLAEMDFAADMPDGDVTAEVLALAGRTATARLFCREDVSMAGAAWHHQIVAAFRARRPGARVDVTCHHADGTRLPAQSTLFEWRGDVADLVALERPFLNFLGRAVGIANATHRYVAEARKYTQHTQILDTRKTLPGYRYLDKYAVLCGGGRNHRLNLSDGVLIKENHIAKLQGVRQALAFVRQNLRKDVPIQIEVTSMQQLREALEEQCPLIMVDNFTPEMVAEACALDRGDSQIEVSGGITLETLGAYCRHSPDRISIGAITHSIKAPDLSLLISED